MSINNNDLTEEIEFIDDENSHYTAKYGNIPLETTHFDDHHLLGENFLEYKIHSIKFFLSLNKDKKKVISGIQTVYKNLLNSSEVPTEEHFGNKKGEIEGFELINLKMNEFITGCRVWVFDQGISKIIFTTSLNKMYVVGDEVGEEKFVDEFEEDKRNILMSFFGTVDTYLSSIGLYNRSKKEQYKYLVGGIIILKVILIKREDFKKQIEDKIKNKELNESEEALARTCLLPMKTFWGIVEFCL